MDARAIALLVRIKHKLGAGRGDALEDVMAAAVIAGAEEERERCARIAESFCDDPPSAIAAEIRGLAGR